MNLRFSIIIPTLNSKLFLEKCIVSILDQSYKNFEIIVIDGKSTDGTVEYLKSLGDKVRWISESDNGQADAINKGINIARGNWITWQNSDDYYYNNNALSLFVRAIKENKSKKLIVGNINLVNFNCEVLRDVKYITPNFYSLLYEGMTLTNQACVWNINLTKDLGILKNFKVNFDYEWFLRILKNFPKCGLHINQTIGCFRLHKLQKTQNQTLYDLNILDEIKKEYGYKRLYLFFFKPYLLLRKFFCYLFQGNFFYASRGIFKFFFTKKNKEYINS